MWVKSKGDEATAVVRNYIFYDSTHPIEPTIVTSILVTEHTVAFGWTNPVYFEVRHIKLKLKSPFRPKMTTFDIFLNLVASKLQIR